MVETQRPYHQRFQSLLIDKLEIPNIPIFDMSGKDLFPDTGHVFLSTNIAFFTSTFPYSFHCPFPARFSRLLLFFGLFVTSFPLNSPPCVLATYPHPTSDSTTNPDKVVLRLALAAEGFRAAH